MGISKTARFSFDLAILLSEVYPELKNVKKSNDGIKIGVSLTRNSSYDGKNIQREIEREESLKKSLENLIDTNQNIKELTFIEFNDDKEIGDQLITQEFYQYFKNKINCSIIKYSNKTESMVTELSKCNFILGTRLHAGIIAYALNIPFMLVEYHPKCTEFLNTINHKYRYRIHDSKKNVLNISSLISNKSVPEIKIPDYFKKIMLEEIKFQSEIR